MVKVRSIELHSYYENTLPTSKYKLIIFTTFDFYFRSLSVLLLMDPFYQSLYTFIFVYYFNNKINYVKYLNIACKIAKIDKIKVIEIVQNNKSKRIESIN